MQQEQPELNLNKHDKAGKQPPAFHTMVWFWGQNPFTAANSFQWSGGRSNDIWFRVRKTEFNDPLSVNHYTLTFFICEMNLNIPAKSNIWKFDIPFDPLNEIYPKEITREVAEI